MNVRQVRIKKNRAWFLHKAWYESFIIYFFFRYNSRWRCKQMGKHYFPQGHNKFNCIRN